MAKPEQKKIFKLNDEKIEDNFFSNTVMIGIGTSLPAYNLCWMLNNYFDLSFARDAENTKSFKKKDTDYFFPLYCYTLPNSIGYRHLLYKLKHGDEFLLPEIKQIDYLWLLQTDNPAADAQYIATALKTMDGIQLVQTITTKQLEKNGHNLII